MRAFLQPNGNDLAKLQLAEVIILSLMTKYLVSDDPEGSSPVAPALDTGYRVDPEAYIYRLVIDVSSNLWALTRLGEYPRSDSSRVFS